MYIQRPTKENNTEINSSFDEKEINSYDSYLKKKLEAEIFSIGLLEYNITLFKRSDHSQEKKNRFVTYS